MELRAISGEHLEVYSETAIHASLLHASKRVHVEVVVWIDALIEAVNSQAAVIARRADKSPCFEGVREKLSVDSRAELGLVVVAAHKFYSLKLFISLDYN